MSAVSTPTPTMLASRRTIAWGPVEGACSIRSRRISSICSRTGQPRQVATELVQRIRRDRHIPGRAQAFEPLWRLAQLRLEAADAEPNQGTLHPVDDARALADQAL